MKEHNIECSIQTYSKDVEPYEIRGKMIKQKSNLQFQESERRPRGKNISVSIYMKFDSFYFDNIFMSLFYIIKSYQIKESNIC